MTSKLIITLTLKRLERARLSNVPIIIDTKLKSVKQLLETLIWTGKVQCIKKYNNSWLVKVLIGVRRIEALTPSVQVKKTDIYPWSQKLLDNSDGHVIITTTKGVISHQKAIEYKVGGEILGYIS